MNFKNQLNELKELTINNMDMVTATQNTVRNEFLEQAYDLMSELDETEELSEEQAKEIETYIENLKNEVVTAFIEEFEKRFKIN